MKVEELIEAKFHETGKWQIYSVGDMTGTGGYILLPEDSAVNSVIRLRRAMRTVDWKANAKTGQMQKLAKMCGKEKEMQAIPKDFEVVDELIEKLLWAMSPCKETYTHEIATQLKDEFNEFGPENWLKKTQKLR